MYDFDKSISRYNTNSLKWDFAKRKFGDQEVMPFWIADSDFKLPEEVINPLVDRVKHGIFGYSERMTEYFESVEGWMEKRFDWKIEKELIASSPGIIAGLSGIIQSFTNPGDKIIIQTPVYDHFFGVIEKNDRVILRNPLKFVNSKYYMDFDDLLKKIDSKTKMMILCSPHNPTGRVWTREELGELCNILSEKNIMLVSDEIHFDLVYKPNLHTPIAKIKENAIVCTAPSKTFNMPGLQTSNIIFPNVEYKEKFEDKMETNGLDLLNSIGIIACESVYTYGEKWLEEMLDYLYGNICFIDEFLKNRIPKLELVKPEGTYLLWINCRELGLNQDQLMELFIKKAKLGINSGANYGVEGKGFIRLNVACPRNYLEKGLKRLENAVNEYFNRNI